MEEWGLIGSTSGSEAPRIRCEPRRSLYKRTQAFSARTQWRGLSSSPLFAPPRASADSIVSTVYDVWLKSKNSDTTALTRRPRRGLDFAGFYHHLGIPSGGIGFDGPDGIYHSMYDSYDWMSRFGDPGYKTHRAGAQLVALILARLANTDLLPLDYAFFGTEMDGLVSQLDSGITRKQWGGTVSTQALKDAFDRFTAVAQAFGAARDSALARASGGGIDSTRARRVNRALMQVERRLTRPEGLASRPWFRSLQFAADLDNGYATMHSICQQSDSL
jgi:N-acetylated-alpha-linked acidic dipeptidase